MKSNQLERIENTSFWNPSNKILQLIKFFYFEILEGGTRSQQKDSMLGFVSE